MKLDGGASLTLITSSIYSSRRSKKNQGNINELACVQITETTREKLRATRAIFVSSCLFFVTLVQDFLVDRLKI